MNRRCSHSRLQKESPSGDGTFGRAWGRPVVWTVFLAAAVAIFVTAENAWTQDRTPQRMEPRTLHRVMENREPLFLVSLDSYLECLDARIRGAICLDGGENLDLPVELPADKETKIVFYGRQAGPPALHPLVKEVLQRDYRHVFILTGGLLGWRRAGYDVEAVQRIPRTSALSLKPSDVASWLRKTPSALIVDIRNAEAFGKGHVEGAMNLPLSSLHRRYPEIPLDRTLLVVDEDGSRAFMAASYLTRKGFAGVRRLAGGEAAWDAYLKRGTAR